MRALLFALCLVTVGLLSVGQSLAAVIPGGLGSREAASALKYASCCAGSPVPAPVTPLSAQVLTDAALAAACTNTASCPSGHAIFAQGVWRVGYNAQGDVEPTFWTPQTGTCASHFYPAPYGAVAVAADHGYCENSADGKSWISPPVPGNGMDYRQFGGTSTGDGTTAAQATLAAAYYLQAGSARFPIAFNYTKLLWPAAQVKFLCGGQGNQLTRTAVGPGVVSTTSPTAANPYASGVFIIGPVMRDCVFNDGNGLAGTNLLLTNLGYGSFENVYSYSKLGGIEFTGSIDGSNVLTISNIDGGTMIPGAAGTGMVVMCAGDSSQNCIRSDVTLAGLGSAPAVYPRVVTQASGATGVAGTYNLTSNSRAVSSREMVGLVSWQWMDAPNTPIIGSAPITILEAVFDSHFSNVYAGGVFTANAGACANFTGAGLYLDEVVAPGEKPNANTFSRLYTPCTRVGLLLANGADNTILGMDGQFSNWTGAIGIGISNAVRTYIVNPYVEGASVTPQITEIGFNIGYSGTGTRIIGAGSGNGTAKLMVVYSAGNCWDIRDMGPNTFSDAPLPDQLYCPQAGPPMVTGIESDFYNPPWHIASEDSINVAGTGYVTADTVTLNDGCTTHGVLTVTAAAGVITSAVVTTVGSCAARPTNPVAQLSTSGVGVGAKFNLSYTTPALPPPGVITAERGFWYYGGIVYATAPTCNAAAQGQAVYITDSNTATFNATIAGAGANKVVGICDGANWKVH